ncbi:hypothetical protein [Streptomyces noursei]|uniref:hypothetical protein n=1 Tax=Streptomyces noursei TaxID=1971 RepID=UPI0023B7CFCD|nr:hypothetical protein [Streptomyces noursei]
MSSFNATYFLEPNADAQGSGIPFPTLYVQPDGGHSGSVNLQMRSSLTPDEQLRIADSFLQGVQRWRDQIAADAERRRTAEDELAEARAEIARLKGEHEDGVE